MVEKRDLFAIIDDIERFIEEINDSVADLRSKLCKFGDEIEKGGMKTKGETVKLRKINLKYNSKCNKCGKFLKAGFVAYYEPQSKKIYCSCVRGKNG